MEKPIMLVYWDYRRRDLLAPFQKLAADFEWHFIFFRSNAADTAAATLPFKIWYWGDFRSPYQLLDVIRPHKVIFAELCNINATSLNIACKNRGIQTLLLDHGLKLPYDYYLSFEKSGEQQPAPVTSGMSLASMPRLHLPRLHTLMFYLSSARLRNAASWPVMLYYLLRVMRKKSERVYTEVKFPLRNADRYLLFSSQNLAYYQVRDGVSEQDVHYVGNPYFDDLVQTGAGQGAQPYYLLLDDGNVECFGISAIQKCGFINRLNAFCRGRGARLYVKLHPYDYRRNDLPQDANIVYYRECGLRELISGAQGCFGISSTLVLPLLPAGRIILFRLPNCGIQDVLEPYGTPFLDFMNFRPEDIDFERMAMPQEQRQVFVNRFLYKNDGRATERLREVLI
jgi:hypothetical protein